MGAGCGIWRIRVFTKQPHIGVTTAKRRAFDQRYCAKLAQLAGGQPVGPDHHCGSRSGIGTVQDTCTDQCYWPQAQW